MPNGIDERCRCLRQKGLGQEPIVAAARSLHHLRWEVRRLGCAKSRFERLHRPEMRSVAGGPTRVGVSLAQPCGLRDVSINNSTTFRVSLRGSTEHGTQSTERWAWTRGGSGGVGLVCGRLSAISRRLPGRQVTDEYSAERTEARGGQQPEPRAKSHSVRV